MKKLLSLTLSTIILSGMTACAPSGNIFQIAPSSENGYLAQRTETLANINSKYTAEGLSKISLNLKLNRNLSKNEIRDFANKYSLKVTRTIDSIKYLSVEANKVDKDLIAKLQKDKLVKMVNPEYRIDLPQVKIEPVVDLARAGSVSAMISDPLASEQYSLKLVNAEQAWETNSGNANIKVAVVDTGVDLNHPDLKSKIVPGKNIVDPAKEPLDDDGHGTHCAGIAAATVDNGEGVAGMGNKVSVMPVKVLSYGSGNESTIAAGITWAADNGANVITMSIGLYRSSKLIEDALQYALDKNVVLVASAGNNNSEYSVHLPSTYPGVIEVAATDAQDKKASYSNYGKKVSVAAPGSAIISTLPTYETRKPKNYGKLSGTSMAAPHVAGLAALILSKNPNLKYTEVTKIIEGSAKDLGDQGWDKYYGHGRIDLLEAMKKI